ncbi:MAG TPA: META domain-containing protein [Flavobacterium sp.]|nr:META domain-containing protein [Flavobacterium sp.]
MKKTSILVLIIMSFSCNCKKNITETPTQNINRIWMLVEFKEYKKEYFVEKKAFLDMTNSENVSANMGCITQNFSYSIKNNSIKFEEKIRINMKCQEMKLDIDFANSIIEMNSFSINAHKLTLTAVNGDKMVFIAQDWD